jgi:hypothetical protein
MLQQWIKLAEPPDRDRTGADGELRKKYGRGIMLPGRKTQGFGNHQGSFFKITF